MKLPTCNECNQTFEWRKVFISLWKNSEIQCRHCGANHNIPPRLRLITSAMLFMPVMLTNNLFYNFLSNYLQPNSDMLFIVNLSASCLLGGIISLFLPYFARYQVNEKQRHPR